MISHENRKYIFAIAICAILAFGLLLCKGSRNGELFGNQDESPLKKSSDVEQAWVIQNCFRQIYDLYSERVVYVSTEQKVQIPYNPFNEMFGIPQEETRTGLGSGFILTDDGFICTNFHVIAPGGRIVDKITVIVENTSYKAEVRGYDNRIDIALLKIESKKKLNPVYLGNSDEVKVGDWAIAIGNPFGLSKSFTVGVVSATGRKNVSEDRESYIQTDAAINPGNSGGPLINIKGEVIGMNRMIYSQSGGYMGIGFAIPVNRVKSVLEKLKSGKPVKQGYLGAVFSEITPVIAYQLNWQYNSGVVVERVIPKSPAAFAGIQRGDILYVMNGQEIRDPGLFLSALENIAPGESVEFLGWRAGQKMKVTVKMGERGK